jgi:hypothetical protein
MLALTSIDAHTLEIGANLSFHFRDNRSNDGQSPCESAARQSLRYDGRQSFLPITLLNYILVLVVRRFDEFDDQSQRRYKELDAASAISNGGARRTSGKTALLQ